jgi:fermentation-respiration switch protein FrsA (DUF1100 family)
MRYFPSFAQVYIAIRTGHGPMNASLTMEQSFTWTNILLAIVISTAASYLVLRFKPTTCTTKPRDNMDMEAKVSKIMHIMQTENWAELLQQFTPLLRLVLTETILGKGWRVLSVTSGPLQSLGTPVISTGWLTTAKVPLHFTRSNLAMVLRMTSSGSLVGLRIVPLNLAELGAVWKCPAYADMHASRREELRLGSKHKVGGTLDLPKEVGKYPCVIFLAGSGPADRDSTIGATKPFADIALGLAARQIASIRFDKVTLSHGKRFMNSTTITLTEEYMDQALDAIRHAQSHSEIDESRIYILGHSLGGVVAPKIAHTNDAVKGCIVMAAPTVPMYRSYIRQLQYMVSLDGEASASMKEEIKDAERAADLADSAELSLATKAASLPFGLPATYWLDYRVYDPVATAEKMDKPILVLQGSRDCQVTAADDYVEWGAALEGKENAEFHLYKGLNHGFIKGEGPSTAIEYDLPGNVDEDVVRDISGWIQLGKCEV